MSARCGVCAKDFSDLLILNHLRDEHGQDTSLMSWPDGQPVVVDHTIKPRTSKRGRRMSEGLYTWRCTLCDTGNGTTNTEPAAAQAFLNHYRQAHPNAIEKWNHDMKEGAGS